MTECHHHWVSGTCVTCGASWDRFEADVTTLRRSEEALARDVDSLRENLRLAREEMMQLKQHVSKACALALGCPHTEQCPVMRANRAGECK